jgi:hypothetical protein
MTRLEEFLKWNNRVNGTRESSVEAPTSRCLKLFARVHPSDTVSITTKAKLQNDPQA